MDNNLWVIRLGESSGLGQLARVHLYQGRSQEALDFLDQAEAASDGSQTRIADGLAVSAAEVLLAKGELTRALEQAQRGTTRRQERLT